MTSAATIAISLGMNDSVISLICVAACRIDTTRPTTSAASSRGADNTSMTYSACCPMVITLCGVILRTLKSGSFVAAHCAAQARTPLPLGEGAGGVGELREHLLIGA